jgi:hypothetical protein
MGTARGAVVRVALVGAIAAACASTAAAQTTVAATAVDVAKAGRWSAVRVTIDHAGADLAGELIVTWGGHEVRRRVSLVSSGRHQFELYTRTTAPESSIRVRLVVSETEVEALDVKMRVLPDDEIVTLCVVSANDSTADAPCSALVPASALPTSHRGYDVVDRVVWPTGYGPETWTAAQRLAFERWQALRRLDRSGALGLTPGVNRPAVDRGLPLETSRVVAAGAAAYCFLLVITGLTTQRSRARLAVVLGATAGLITAGVAGVYAIGRVGTPPIVLHHESQMQQLPGTVGSLLTVHAIAEFPAFEQFDLRLSAPDASLETVTRSGRTETIDEEGYPVLSGMFGLGNRQAFSVEATTAIRYLEVVEENDIVRITNTSNVELTGCRFMNGFSTTTPNELQPSASIEARRPAEVHGPAFTCQLPVSVLIFADSRRPVRSRGRTTVVAYLAGLPGPETTDD